MFKSASELTREAKGGENFALSVELPITLPLTSLSFFQSPSTAATESACTVPAWCCGNHAQTTVQIRSPLLALFKSDIANDGNIIVAGGVGR